MADSWFAYFRLYVHKARAVSRCAGLDRGAAMKSLAYAGGKSQSGGVPRVRCGFGIAGPPDRVHAARAEGRANGLDKDFRMNIESKPGSMSHLAVSAPTSTSFTSPSSRLRTGPPATNCRLNSRTTPSPPLQVPTRNRVRLRATHNHPRNNPPRARPGFSLQVLERGSKEFAAASSQQEARRFFQEKDKDET